MYSDNVKEFLNTMKVDFEYDLKYLTEEPKKFIRTVKEEAENTLEDYVEFSDDYKFMKRKQ